MTALAPQPSDGAPQCTLAYGLGGRCASGRFPCADPYLVLHLTHGSRKIEDESERSLFGPEQSAHYLLTASHYLNIGAGDDPLTPRVGSSPLACGRNPHFGATIVLKRRLVG